MYKFRGLSLLEVLIAAVIMVVAFIPVFSIFSKGHTDSLESEAISVVTRIVQTGVDEINAMEFNDLSNALYRADGDKSQYNFTNSAPPTDVCIKMFEMVKELNNKPEKGSTTMQNVRCHLDFYRDIPITPSGSEKKVIIKATITLLWDQRREGHFEKDKKITVSTLVVNKAVFSKF